MTKTKRRVIAVTGASRGIGRFVALELARRGHLTYATMRDTMDENRQALAELCRTARGEDIPLRIVEVDVTDDGSVAHGIRAIELEAGRIDVVVHGACVSASAASDTLDVDELRRQLEVNVHGVLRVNRAVLPDMRQRGEGLLIHLGEPASNRASGADAASGRAVDALAESLRTELAPAGVDSVIVDPLEGALCVGGPSSVDARNATVHAIVELVESSGERPLRTIVEQR